MSKKATASKEHEVKQYVILENVWYKTMIPAEREFIKAVKDPYAEDAPRRPFEHLGEADINRLLMRGIIAEDKQEIKE
jgi:hypothetical protein